MQQQRTLRDAWISTMNDLGAVRGVDTLLIGPHAEVLADELPGPTGGTSPGVAALGVGPVPDGATPTATGFSVDSFDAAVILSAWETPAGVASVVEEAMRVVRPGGTVWLGDIDAKALTSSMPAARRYGLFYRSDPQVADAARFRYRTADVLGVDAVRAGLRNVTETKSDLPVAVIDSAAAGVEAVRSGIWPGTDVLDPTSLDRLLERTDESLQANRRVASTADAVPHRHDAPMDHRAGTAVLTALQAPNRCSRMSVANGAIASHDVSGVLDRVTKSAVMNTLVTPSIATSAAAVGSSTSRPATNVAGPPTSTPTVNLRALGLGVLEICTAISIVEASAPTAVARQFWLPVTCHLSPVACSRSTS